MTETDGEDVQERVAWFFHGTCEMDDRELRESVLRRRREIELKTGRGTVDVDRFWSPGCMMRAYYVLSMDARVYEEFSGNPRWTAYDTF